MASTTFIDNQTVIVAAWLNDVNSAVYDGESISGILNGSTLALQTGGLDALNIDASQNVSIANLTVTDTIDITNDLTLIGNLDVGGSINFADGTVQTTAAYMGANNCMFENNMTITDDYTITAGRSASSVGPITIDSGVSVTIPSGSNWVIL
jgi:hypothetical protein